MQVAQRAVALRIFETQMGADHTHTAWGLHSLAIVLRAQGDLDHAQALHRRALAIREARLGADHPHTAHSLHTLAVAMQTQATLTTPAHCSRAPLPSTKPALAPTTPAPWKAESAWHRYRRPCKANDDTRRPSTPTDAPTAA